jgi:hypothetical protein
LTLDVMSLQRRVLAVKTVLLGMASRGPSLSRGQGERLARNAAILANEADEARGRYRRA